MFADANIANRKRFVGSVAASVTYI